MKGGRGGVPDDRGGHLAGAESRALRPQFPPCTSAGPSVAHPDTSTTKMPDVKERASRKESSTAEGASRESHAGHTREEASSAQGHRTRRFNCRLTAGRRGRDPGSRHHRGARCTRCEVAVDVLQVLLLVATRGRCWLTKCLETGPRRGVGESQGLAVVWKHLEVIKSVGKRAPACIIRFLT